MLADALKETPLKGRSERVKVGGDEFLILKLDGSLVPWDMIPIGMIEEKEGEFAPLVKKLKSLTLTVAVGVLQQNSAGQIDGLGIGAHADGIDRMRGPRAGQSSKR